MSTRIQKRRGTAAAWTSANPVLAAGEEGWETDTHKGKTGDGSTAWTSLDYDVVPDVLGTFVALAGGSGSRVSGDLYWGNALALYARNAAGNAELQVLSSTNGDDIVLGNQSASNDLLIVSGGAGDVWVTPGGSLLLDGPLRVNGQTDVVTARIAADTGQTANILEITTVGGGMVLASVAIDGKVAGTEFTADDGAHVKVNAWTAVSGGVGFTNSWANAGGGNPAAQFRYTPDGKHVELTGIITGGASASSAFTLPAGYRPASVRSFASMNGSTGAQLSVAIDPSGTVSLYGGVAGNSHHIFGTFALLD